MYEYFCIQIYNNQRLSNVNYSTSPNPPPPTAYNIWMQTHNTTGQLWEVHLRRDLPYYAAARHKVHAVTGTIDGYHMAISLRY